MPVRPRTGLAALAVLAIFATAVSAADLTPESSIRQPPPRAP
jgi:hypothetical protein